MGLMLILAIAIILAVFIIAAFIAFSGNEQQRELLRCTQMPIGSTSEMADLRAECLAKYHEKYD